MSADLQAPLIVGAACTFVFLALWASRGLEDAAIERHARKRVAEIRRRADELRSQARAIELEEWEEWRKKGSHNTCPTCGAVHPQGPEDKKISLRGGQPT